MRCTGYEMARYMGTQASHLYEKSMHTLQSIMGTILVPIADHFVDNDGQRIRTNALYALTNVVYIAHFP